MRSSSGGLNLHPKNPARLFKLHSNYRNPDRIGQKLGKNPAYRTVRSPNVVVPRSTFVSQ
jgi:hypothetical protein